MAQIFPAVCLEDAEEPSWERAMTRLAVAFETFTDVEGIWLVIDETPEAFANALSYLAHLGDDTPGGVVAGAEYFSANAIYVQSWRGAQAALYPYFHNGEEMPK